MAPGVRLFRRSEERPRGVRNRRVNIYVESNFVLELALHQEQHASCDEIVRLCEAQRARLVLPAYSLVEPWETLIRRRRERKRLVGELNKELGQLMRSAAYAAGLAEFANVTALLVDSADEDIERLEEVQRRLMSICEIISLDAGTLAAAARHRVAHDLSPQDAIVYASVLVHLRQSAPAECCFLNRNSKDFDDQDIVDELGRQACKMIWRFDHGLEYVRNQFDDG